MTTTHLLRVFVGYVSTILALMYFALSAASADQTLTGLAERSFNSLGTHHTLDRLGSYGHEEYKNLGDHLGF